ncbi:hypothetical protein QJS66_11980 [Kocuria rhizophila]|nr:hypothetical protein QJS66_11980 [Kocuria rhizophila]
MSKDSTGDHRRHHQPPRGLPHGTLEPHYDLNEPLATDEAGCSRTSRRTTHTSCGPGPSCRRTSCPSSPSIWDRSKYNLDLVRRMASSTCSATAWTYPACPCPVAAGLVGHGGSLARGQLPSTVSSVQGGLAMRSIALCSSRRAEAALAADMATGKLLVRSR